MAAIARSKFTQILNEATAATLSTALELPVSPSPTSVLIVKVEYSATTNTAALTVFGRAKGDQKYVALHQSTPTNTGLVGNDTAAPLTIETNFSHAVSITITNMEGYDAVIVRTAAPSAGSVSVWLQPL